MGDLNAGGIVARPARDPGCLGEIRLHLADPFVFQV
jgi:hypothetical protein